MKKRLVFRCNANKSSGLGHLTRCLNIAKSVRDTSDDFDIVFLGDFTNFAKELISSSFFVLLDGNKLNINDLLVLDDYDITQFDISDLRNKVKTFIKIDDFNDLNLTSLDLVINFRVNAERESYACANECLGVNYFPFDASLIDIRKKNIVNKLKNSLKNIYIFIGGTDLTSSGLELLQLVDQAVENCNIFLIDNKYKNKPIEVSQRNKLNYLPMIKDISQYYQNADAFITGGGVSKYEVGFCAIPNAAISQTLGQAEDTIILANENVTANLGLTKDLKDSSNDILIKLREFFSTSNQVIIKDNCIGKYSSQSTANLVESILKVIQ